MNRSIFFLLLLLALPVSAQDEASEDEPVTDPASETAEDEIDEVLDDILGGNQDHTEEDEDIFVPTEEISYQQSIPFPTDI